MIKITVIQTSDVDLEKIRLFKSENWGQSHDTPEDHVLNFFRPNDYYVLAHAQSKLVGSIALQIRKDIKVNDTPATCGMIGGVVVHKDHRMQGIAQMMLKEAMAKFAKEKVDIALLCTNIPKLSKLYSRVGFVVLNKPYYFYNRDGILSSDNDGMIASVSNREMYDLALQKNTKINIGPSNA